jgi:hypothetical protein
MTRKIEREMVAAVLNGRDYRNANTRVTHANDRAYVYLHGHNIAQVFDGYLTINDCGYQTVTTKSRLNALLHGLDAEAGIYQKAYVWYLAGAKGTTEVDSKEWYTVPCLH